jgi:5-methylcytosine-specific restriction endonuclease McrA
MIQPAQKMREYRQRHPGVDKESKERYRAKPQTQIREKAVRLAKDRRWRSDNREKVRASQRRQNHIRRASEGSYTDDQLMARVIFWGGLCYLCGCDWEALPTKANVLLGQRYKTIDHVKPVSRGGSSWPANLRPACNLCNSSKNARNRGVIVDARV